MMPSVAWWHSQHFMYFSNSFFLIATLLCCTSYLCVECSRTPVQPAPSDQPRIRIVWFIYVSTGYLFSVGKSLSRPIDIQDRIQDSHIMTHA
ncbi:hypothetical protein GGR51DRAFT_542729 [Nemania sp. FL0031]|nr:hypothetical protein GGR51DRAFT_542729 [Nemania sp. FL0031]